MEANKALAEKGLAPVDENYLLDEEEMEEEIANNPETNVTEE